jgi:hypothetical protein
VAQAYSTPNGRAVRALRALRALPFHTLLWPVALSTECMSCSRALGCTEH